jgi:hypothetical protein
MNGITPEARAESYALAFHRVRLDGRLLDSIWSARILDRFERRAGIWRIAERQVVYDWNIDSPTSETWSRGFFSRPTVLGARGPADPAASW